MELADAFLDTVQRRQRTGLIVRGSMRSEAKTYVTDIPARDDVRIRVAGIGLDGELGWQIAGDWGQAAILAGVAWRDYVLSPDDPNSRLGPNQLHARISAHGHVRLPAQHGAHFGMATIYRASTNGLPKSSLTINWTTA